MFISYGQFKDIPVVKMQKTEVLEYVFKKENGTREHLAEVMKTYVQKCVNERARFHGKPLCEGFDIEQIKSVPLGGGIERKLNYIDFYRVTLFFEN